MRPGFFGGGAPAAKPTEPFPPQGTDQGVGTAAPAAPPPQPPATAALSAEQRERGLEQCLQLLKGPSDETRFVGLLLVTKILPVGDEATIQRVLDAVGFTFLSRLLLPLQTQKGGTSPGATVDPEALAKQAAMARLGIAVLSSFARLPELAGSEDMVEKLPLFLKVAREGGVAPALAAAGTGPGTPLAAEEEEEAASAEAAAVEDALECALAVAQSGEEGRQVALESGALGAAAAVLQRWAAAADFAGSAGSAGVAAAKGPGLQACLLAVRLAWAVLGGGQSVQAAIAGHTESVKSLTPPLTSLLALPASLSAARSTPSSVAGSGSSAPSGAAAAAAAPDVAALQLEVLHLLHLLLVHATAGDAGADPLRALLSQEAQVHPPQLSWADGVREGLAVVLRGRVSPSERHTALQLAAAVVELCGPEWLLGPCCGGAAGAAATQRAAHREQQQRKSGGKGMGSKEGSSPGSFYQLLVEMVKIETSVLLLDALAPAAPVPLAGQWVPPPPAPSGAGGTGSTSSEAGMESGTEEEGEEGQAEAAAAASGSGMDIEEIGAGAEGAAAAGGGSADVGMLREVLRSEGEQAKLEERWREEEQRQQQQRQRGSRAVQGGEAAAQLAGLARKVEEMELPSEIRWQGPSETAGERAARQLPACFLLIEACIEALALNAERAEEGMEGEQEGNGGTPPQLPDAVALRAMASLQEVCEALLQFLEQTVGSSGSDSEAAQGQDPGRRALVAAAVRVVGRFCGEAPDAFGPRLRQLLPSLLAYFQAQGDRGGGGGGGEDSPLPFLLPALLQQVVPAAGGSAGRQEQATWVQTLVSEQVLPQLTSYVSAAAEGFCHALELAPVPSSAADVQAAGARLQNAGALLLQLVTAGPAGGHVAVSDGLVTRLLRVAERLLEEQPVKLFELRLLGVCVALLASLAAAAAAAQGAGSPVEAFAETELHRTSVVVLHSLRLTVEALRQLEGSSLLQPGGSVLVGVGMEEDEGELLLDLTQNLNAIATAAARLMQCCPDFAGSCSRDGWLGGVLTGGGLPGLGLSHETTEEAAGLEQFLHAALAAQAAQAAQR